MIHLGYLIARWPSTVIKKDLKDSFSPNFFILNAFCRFLVPLLAHDKPGSVSLIAFIGWDWNWKVFAHVVNRLLFSALDMIRAFFLACGDDVFLGDGEPTSHCATQRPSGMVRISHSDLYRCPPQLYLRWRTPELYTRHAPNSERFLTTCCKNQFVGWSIIHSHQGPLYAGQREPRFVTLKLVEV